MEGAREAIGYGAEVIIAQGKQGGGHVRGFQDGNPLHRSELVPLVKSAVPENVLVLGSGGIADGRTLMNVLAEGADGGWVGTRFAVSRESYAHEEYMRRVIAVQDGWKETAAAAIFGPEFPQAGVDGAQPPPTRGLGLLKGVVNQVVSRVHFDRPGGGIRAICVLGAEPPNVRAPEIEARPATDNPLRHHFPQPPAGRNARRARRDEETLHLGRLAEDELAVR